MKNYFFSLFLMMSISVQAQSSGPIKIEFQSLSRGYLERVTITSDSLILTKKENRNNDEWIQKRIISKKEWKNLLRDMNNINLQSMPELESPTNKRAYDGARHTSIRITTSEQTYEHLFDDENPHAELNPLLICIKSIAY